MEKLTKESKILTERDIKKLNSKDLCEKSINEGLVMAEKRLDSILKSIKTLEEKAMKLFTMQITMFVFSALMFTTKFFNVNKPHLYIVLVCFLIGIIYSIMVLNISKNGTQGEEPKYWLTKEIIANKNNELVKNKLYTLENYVERIEESKKSNMNKAKKLKYAFITTIISMISFVLVLAL